MKISKGLLPLLFFILAVCIFSGCSHIDKTDVEAVITNDLDLLKNLDTDTAQKYVSYTRLFPNTPQEKDLSKEVKEVFSLFFKNFDYKVRSIDVDNDRKSATADLQLSTIDAKSLAKDYAKAYLQSEILNAASSDKADEVSASLEDRYLLLNQLLNSNQYKTVERDCTLTLNNEGTDNEIWEINRTHSLENDLVGGLMTYLSDSDLLSPEETLTVYLNTLKAMDLDQMGNYLGIESLMNTDDSDKNSIAAALVEQVHDHFDFKITDCKIHGYQASLSTEITTFDSSAILAAYQAQQDTYLASPEAVIDGSSKRYEKSLDLLLENIKNNTATRTATATFHLTNDGVSWKLQDSNSSVGSAIFGTLSTTPVAEESDTDTEE